MTAFDNIKTNNWPSASNEFEDFLVLKLPLNDQASLTESLPVVAGSKLLFPKRTLTNTGVSSEARAISSHALTFRGAASPTAHLSNNTQTSGTWWYNTDHYDSNDVANTSFADWVFDPPLDDVTSIEVDSRHDSQYFNPYYYQVYDENDAALVASPADKTGTGQGNYTSIYSGSATKVKRIKQYGGGGIDDFYGIKINGTILNQSNGISGLSGSGTQATATYSIGGSPGKHYDNNAGFSSGHLDLENSLSTEDSSLTFGGGNFTIEAWVNISDTTASNPLFAGQVDGGTAGGSSYIITLDTTNGRTPRIHVGGAVQAVSWGSAFSANTWYHVAMVRDGNTLRLYRDGVQSNSAACSGAVNTGSTTYKPSAGSMVFAGTRYTFQGQIQDLRIYKGLCKYPGGTSFTPPSAILG